MYLLTLKAISLTQEKLARVEIIISTNFSEAREAEGEGRSEGARPISPPTEFSLNVPISKQLSVLNLQRKLMCHFFRDTL